MDTEAAVLDGAPNQFDRPYVPGLPLRPAPPRVRPTTEWAELRQRLLSPWIDVKPVPDVTPHIRLLNDHFWEGDRVMEPVVDMLHRVGTGAGRGMLTQALDHGIESLDDPPAELVDLFAHLDRKPEWFDAESFERGRLALVNGTLFGKVAAFTVNSALTALGEAVSAATGSSGRLVQDPVRRQLETSEFFMRVTKPDVTARHSAGFRDIVLVRLMHTQARRGLRSSWGPQALAHHGSPISNTDMALGIPTFGILQAMYDSMLGAQVRPRTFEDINMYWGYLAYLFGVSEAIIPRTPQDAIRQLDYMLATQGPGTEWSDEIAQALMRYPLDVMISAVESPVIRWLARSAGVPLYCGYVQYICGRPLAPRLLSSICPARRLDRLQPVAAAAAHLAVRASWLSQQRSGWEAKARARAAGGDPFQNAMNSLIVRASAKADVAGWTFTSHDRSTEQSFSRLQGGGAANGEHASR